MSKVRDSLYSLLAPAAAVLLLAGPVPAQDPIITEFMAVNERTFADEDGEYPDWIEIFNPGQSPVNLEGWALSDEITHPTKWRFPAVTLQPGSYLLVFASEKNRRSPGSPLHTNFRLSGEPEFLGLSNPQGTLISGFSPEFPYQFPSISYGHPQESASLALVAEGASSSILVPTSGALGTTWIQPGFSDAAWTRGPTGVGYDTGSDYASLIGTDIEGALRARNSSVYVRVPFELPDPSGVDSLTLRLKYDDGFVAYLNGREVARRNAPGSLAYNSAATAEHGQPVTGFMGQDFDAAGTAYTLTAHAEAAPPQVLTGGPDGRFLRLVPDNTGSLTNTIGFARSSGPTATDLLTASFDYRMPVEAGHTGCCGERADGFGFALLSTVEYGASGAAPALPTVAWERPILPDAFAVGFDIFDGTGTENTVSLNWNGAEVGAVRVAELQLNNGVFNRVRVEVRRQGTDSLVNLWITPDSLGPSPGAEVRVFADHLVRGFNPLDLDSRVAFGGRTGGAFTAVDLDNVQVEFGWPSDQISYEDFDLTAHRGALRAGSNVLAFHGLNRSAGDADFLLLPILTAMDFGRVDTAVRHYFTQPTPGAPNSAGLPGVAPEPLASHQSGAYRANFSLSLSLPAGTTGATIRYTTSGAEPTAASPAYSTPITISRNTVVKARTFKAGVLPSRTVERFLVRLETAAGTFDSNLPLVIADTFGQGIGQSTYTAAWTAIIDLGGDGRSSITAPPSFAGFGGLKVRGSSSTGFPKKQFAFEVWDAARQDIDVSLLGMSSESDWILYGPYTDKTLMRDALSYQWSNEIDRYAVRGRFVEVFLKSNAAATLGMGDYVGVYVLFEKIKRARGRVEIRRLTPTDDAEPNITGGYILKKDRLDPGDSGLRTSLGHVLGFVDPKEIEITPPQRAYIQGYLDEFEAVLMGPNFRDPVDGFRNYIDVDSFIDHHIMVELTKNIDGYRLSTFMYKDRGGKLHLGPIWDYNLCLGNANYLQGWEPQGWYWSQLGDGDYPWFRRIFQDGDFAQAYIDRWTALRRVQFRAEELLADVDAAWELLAEAQERNYQRWPILGSYVWPNWYIGATFDEEVDWMKGWIEGRLAWYDSNYLSPPSFNQDGGIIPPGFILSMSAPAGTIYYTLDRTDPRLPGGGVSASARPYGSSAQVVLLSSGVTPRVRVHVPTQDLGLTWTALGFSDTSWTLGTAGVGVGYETQTGYESYIELDVRAQMYNVSPTIYIRIPFNVEDPGALNALTLKMMYEDGFVAYLNGQKVAESNIPAPLVWNSAAPTARDETQAVTFQSFSLTDRLGLLRQGANVLAIHGLNAGAGSSDFLLVPQLVGSGSFSGDPIAISGATHVIARTWLDDRWSGRSEATFVQDVDLPLRITEIMYHPEDPPSGDIHDADDFEFIEISNVGSTRVSLLGAAFTDGIDFSFSSGAVDSLGPGEHLVLVKNLEAFSLRYATAGMKIAGQYQGNLENDGESLILRDGRGEIILFFSYDDLWYAVTDGDGYSLAIVDPGASPASWGDRASWRPSADRGGSPGEGESTPTGGFQLPADVNQDASLDLSDALALLLHLYGGGSRPLPCQGTVSEPANRAVLDLNADGTLDVSDAILSLNYLFRSGPPPALGRSCLRIADCPDACFN